LDFRNFRLPADKKGYPKKSEIHKTIAMFSAKMSDEHNEFLQHYITKRQEIPFWVLINTLTMGEIFYVFYYLKDSQRNAIALYFTKHRRKEYNNLSINISVNEIDTFLSYARHFRNSCAHNERFYCKNTAMIQDIKKLKDKMGNFLSKKDFATFQKKIDSIFLKYTSAFSTVSILTIKRKAGF